MLINLIKNEFTKGKRNLVILFVLAVPIGVAMLLCVDFFMKVCYYLNLLKRN